MPKFLFAVNSSEKCRVAFEIALKFLNQDDYVYLLTITEVLNVNPNPIFNQIKASNLSSINKQISVHSGELLNECAAKLNAKGVPNSTLLEKGEIKDVICQKAEELGVDMILLGGIEILKPQSVNIIKYVADNAVCSVAVLQEKAYRNDDLRHSSLLENVDNSVIE